MHNLKYHFILDYDSGTLHLMIKSVIQVNSNHSKLWANIGIYEKLNIYIYIVFYFNHLHVLFLEFFDYIALK